MWSAWSAALLCWLALMAAPVGAFPVNGNQTVLPVGTELNEDALDRPREVFRSEALGGRKSYLVNLGDVAFSSPAILGGTARQAGVSCSACHVNGASNPGPVDPTGQFDYDGRSVQFQGEQPSARPGHDPEPARCTLSGSLRP